MIKFFRKIRQNLLSENKFSKYFLYAFGEIVLVVIGILIALQVSNWNQNRIKNSQELDDLENLKEEIQNNISDFKSLDTLYATFERRSAAGLKLFNNNPKVEDFIKIDSLIHSRFTVFPLTTSTYDEMLNTGKFYNLKNKMLKSKITQFYSKSENYSQAFIEINEEVLKIVNHTDLFTYDLLINRLNTEPKNLKGIDTSWIHNLNSPTYLAFYKRTNTVQEYSNKTRRDLIARQILDCKELVVLIDNELGNRK